MADDHFGFDINNPGNIIYVPGAEKAYPGVTGKYSPGNGYTYLQFDSPESGAAAIKQTLGRYGEGTVKDLMTKYAGSYNPNYVKSVASALGVDPEKDTVNFKDPTTADKALPAIIGFETGAKPTRVQAFLSGTTPGKGRKMADIPNMLTPPAPTIGDIANPSPFYQDSPPSGQDEFNQRYQENLSFLQSPEWKAMMMQTAIAALQPRAPGQSPLGAVANAVASGGEAAGRVAATGEELRARGVKESQGQQELDLRAKQIQQTGEVQRGQLKLQEATLAKMDDQSKQAWARLDFDREKLDKDYARIDAEVKRAEGRERVNMLQNLGKMNTDLLKNAQERLGLLKPDTPDYQRVQAEVQAYQSRLDDVMKAYKTEVEKVAPGAFGTQTAATGEPTPVTLDDAKFALWMKNRDQMQKAMTDGVPVGGKLVKIVPTADQKQMWEDSQRVVARSTGDLRGGTLGGRLSEAGREIGRGWRQTFGEDDASNVANAAKGAETPEAWAKLKPDQKEKIRSAIADSMPAEPSKDAQFWQNVQRNYALTAAARKLYGDKIVDQAFTDLKDTSPRKGKSDKRKDTLREALP